MNVIWHHVSFQDFYPLILTQSSDYFPQVFPILLIDYLPSVFRTEDNMVFAHPFGMCQTIRLVCHTLTHLSFTIGLNTFIVTDR